MWTYCKISILVCRFLGSSPVIHYFTVWGREQNQKQKHFHLKKISWNVDYFYFFPILLCSAILGPLPMVLKEMASRPIKLGMDFVNRIRRKWCGALSLCLRTGYVHIS